MQHSRVMESSPLVRVDPASLAVPAPNPPAPAARRGTVCHLIASGFAGGPEKQILEVSALLPALGWGVVIGSFRENRPTVEVIEAAKMRGFRTFLIDTRSPFSPSAVPQLRKVLVAHSVSRLITHGYKSNLIGYLAVKGLPVRQMPIVRGYTGEDWKVRLYETGDRRLLRRFRRVLCVSAGTGRRVAGFGVLEDRIRVLPNGVDVEVEVRPAGLRAEFGLPSGAPVIAAAGRLSPEKGHRFLVDAMRLLDGTAASAHCVILGAGREEPALRAQIERLGLGDRVVLAGFRRNVMDYLAEADLVVNPSLTEGMPNVVLEAMALRRPVVATDVGGVGELVSPGETGWLVPPGEPGALAAAVREALLDPGTAGRLAERGFSLVRERHSFGELARRLVKLLEEEPDREKA